MRTIKYAMARAEVGLGSVSSQCGAKGMALPGAVTYLEEEAKQLNVRTRMSAPLSTKIICKLQF